MLEIVYEGDIIRSVAKELNMPEQKVEYHLEFLKKFIDGVVNSEDIHALHLSDLGVLYRNVKGHATMNTYIKHTASSEKRKAKFEKNERIIENVLEKLKTFENISLHNTRRRIHNPYFTCIKKKKELEEFQNAG